MDKDTAIEINNISKQYFVGHVKSTGSYQTMRDVMTDALKSPYRRVRDMMTGQAQSAANLTDSIWALQDVNFSVKKGEVIGIIGHNGAGKSTLLKILSRITDPTMGEIAYRGRLGALLEVGTGFHPELTGRENIFLNGAILGMKRSEIIAKFDEIIAFAGVEKFVDTPVKHFSSGMYVRLAFAVAAHLEPEVLIVDEVLSVGDADFQKRSLGKMQDVAGSGRTVLFVSHNMAAVNQLCTRSILLKQGQVIADGDTSDVVLQYLSGEASDKAIIDLSNRTDRRGNGKLRYAEVSILNSHGQATQEFFSGSELNIQLRYCNTPELVSTDVALAVRIDDMYGRPMFTMDTKFTSTTIKLLDVEGTVKCKIPELQLLAGTYSLHLWAGAADGREVYDSITRTIEFTVYPANVYKSGRFPDNKHGVMYVIHQWEVE